MQLPVREEERRDTASDPDLVDSGPGYLFHNLTAGYLPISNQATASDRAMP